MKKLRALIILFLTLIACRNPTEDPSSLIIYQPLATHTTLMAQESFFHEVANLGFNTLLLSTNHFSKENLIQAIALAHQAHLAVLLQIQPSASLYEEISSWIIMHQVDGFVLMQIEQLSDRERAKLITHINKQVRIWKQTKSLKNIDSSWGLSGYLIGQSDESQRELFIANTFGINGKRKALHTFMNSFGAQILEESLYPANETPQLLNLFHSVRSIYGKNAQAITMIPPVVASNSTKSLPLLWFTGTLPEPFLYTAMLDPQQDTFLQKNMPSILALRHNHLALQHGKVQLLGHSTTVYSDVVNYRSEQMVRLMNFGDERTILNLTFVSNVVRGKRLIDTATGEVIERVNRGFRIPIEATSTRIFIVQ